MSESTAVESSVRISHDTKSVTDIAKSIDAGPFEIVNITCLGKKLDGQPRLMKVQLSKSVECYQMPKKLRANSRKFMQHQICHWMKDKKTSVYVMNYFNTKKDDEKDHIIWRRKIVRKVDFTPPSADMIPLKGLQVTIRLGSPNPSTLAASYGLDLEHGNKFDSNSINPRVTVATYKSLKCWNTNADSLSNKFNELKSRLTIDKPDIVAIIKVNRKFGGNNVEFDIQNYTKYYSSARCVHFC